MNSVTPMLRETSTNWMATAAELGREFAARAAQHDADNAFVHDNYAALRERGLFKLAIPEDLGGGGGSYREVSDVIRELGRHCGSTALAFAMHTPPLDARRLARAAAIHAHDPVAAGEALAHLGAPFDRAGCQQGRIGVEVPLRERAQELAGDDALFHVAGTSCCAS